MPYIKIRPEGIILSSGRKSFLLSHVGREHVRPRGAVRGAEADLEAAAADVQRYPDERVEVVFGRKHRLSVGDDVERLHQRGGDPHRPEIKAAAGRLSEHAHLAVVRDRLSREVGVEHETELRQPGLFPEIVYDAPVSRQIDVVDGAFGVGTLDAVEEDGPVGVGQIQLRAK